MICNQYSQFNFISYISDRSRSPFCRILETSCTLFAELQAKTLKLFPNVCSFDNIIVHLHNMLSGKYCTVAALKRPHVYFYSVTHIFKLHSRKRTKNNVPHNPPGTLCTHSYLMGAAQYYQITATGSFGNLTCGRFSNSCTGGEKVFLTPPNVSHIRRWCGKPN